MDVGELLEQVKSGNIEVKGAQVQLRNLPYGDLRYAKLDRHRRPRSGFGETVFCQSKPDAYLLEVHEKFYEKDGEVPGIRASESQAELVRTAASEVVYDPISQVLEVEKPDKECRECVAVCTGGMADIPVTRGAAQTIEYFIYSASRILDVRVTGTHRLLAQKGHLGKAGCIVTVAGMEGALGTAIADLVECSVVAVPTFAGYGVSSYGLSTLLAMLNSCANRISVVNIDNGYGADYLVAQINKVVVG